MSAQVLVVDDEPLIRQSLQRALAAEGYEVGTAASGAEARRELDGRRPDVVLLDLVLGDADGLDVLRRIHEELPDAKVLVVTAHASVPAAVAAMKLGAYDFIRKPFELEEVLATVRNALRTASLERRVEYLGDRSRGRGEAGGIVHASAAMSRVIEEATVIARSPVPVVLIVGESGAGKQLLARLVHDQSPRARGPFVELNVATVPENLVESELFGHERGAFSGAGERKLGLVEVADGGTLFLDEIGDLGPALQAKLLTFLENMTFRRLGSTALRRVDARIVSATNRDLPAMVEDRSFRADLWYRLSAMTLRPPPLRERQEDIGPLAEHFLAESRRAYGRHWTGLAPETIATLRQHRWPGNVRELRAVINRAALMFDGDRLLVEHLPSDLVSAALAAPAAAGDLPAGGAATGAMADIPTLEQVELAHIRRVLGLCGGNRTLAAQHLGITRQTLTRRLGDGA